MYIVLYRLVNILIYHLLYSFNYIVTNISINFKSNYNVKPAWLLSLKDNHNSGVVITWSRSKFFPFKWFPESFSPNLVNYFMSLKMGTVLLIVTHHFNCGFQIQFRSHELICSLSKNKLRTNFWKMTLLNTDFWRASKLKWL